MKEFMTTLTLLCIFIFGSFANASAINVQRRDMKLASQVLLEHQLITAPIVSNATNMKALTATSATLTTTFTTFLAQPDVPRNIITTGGTTADCKLASVVVSGTNFLDQAITESFAIADNQAGATNGAKAFKSVSSVAIPPQDGAGCTYSVGVGDVLGLKRCMDAAGNVAFAVFNGAYEATRPTCLADAMHVESNTCDINGTLNGAKNVDLYFIQNFACLP